MWVRTHSRGMPGARPPRCRRRQAAATSLAPPGWPRTCSRVPVLGYLAQHFLVLAAHAHARLGDFCAVRGAF
ncbi:hypothetical protein CTAM01_16315 [Colletotrichum tamarilloi]|uniref:Uncharacterized protein n=1 Tax=Colletotrichum tamarilloi TaxID=1209934 RepID=A0ABQ9QIX3_9PEZI|nr:uncharacterized protein CTAM01_16315 [Colletotrichum tamarilloi]KAK1472709.1 hypothetical protein CTAM01_16315 [Colletotrichum tamarilloi]